MSSGVLLYYQKNVCYYYKRINGMSDVKYFKSDPSWIHKNGFKMTEKKNEFL